MDSEYFLFSAKKTFQPSQTSNILSFRTRLADVSLCMKISRKMYVKQGDQCRTCQSYGRHWVYLFFSSKVRDCRRRTASVLTICTGSANKNFALSFPWCAYKLGIFLWTRSGTGLYSAFVLAIILMSLFSVLAVADGKLHKTENLSESFNFSAVERSIKFGKMYQAKKKA